jgi:hypothetical protein
MMDALKLVVNATGWTGLSTLSQTTKLVRYGLRLAGYVENGAPQDRNAYNFTRRDTIEGIRTTSSFVKFLVTPLKFAKALQNLGWVHERVFLLLPAGWQTTCALMSKCNIALLCAMSSLELVDLALSEKRPLLKVAQTTALMVGTALYLNGAMTAASIALTTCLVLGMVSCWNAAFPSAAQAMPPVKLA